VRKYYERIMAFNNRKTLPVTDAARVSYFLAFDIVPDFQVAIEELAKSLPPLEERFEGTQKSIIGSYFF
jgi:hypothetical protein